ncbi:MAG: SpoIIE family protein phosphatase [Bacteroidales bacterium]|nr:SpoIIE family protein phosphatase [Bacteroidales bacterium]
MSKEFHIEVDCQQRNHHNEKICGDVFLSKRIREEGRIIAVLSDGMGHGVKANILATLSSVMALNFTREHKEVEKIASVIMKTLPVCSVRKISYSTFTIIDIEADGTVTILEFDNPGSIIMRRGEIFRPPWEAVKLTEGRHLGKNLNTCSFKAEKEDRIIFCTDGVVQSGMGSDRLPFGWGRDELQSYTLMLTGSEPAISAGRLATKIITMAHKNDGYRAMDDTSCASIYFREPRKLLLCTGPPYDSEKDSELAGRVTGFEGKVILSGGTTADIIARETDREVIDDLVFEDPELPPESFIEGIDLVTEGILTLQKVAEILDDYKKHKPGKGPADKIVKLLMESDEIRFVTGTRINTAHQDPTLPVDLEIRRNVVRKIAAMLEEKWLKEVYIEFI